MGMDMSTMLFVSAGICIVLGFILRISGDRSVNKFFGRKRKRAGINAFIWAMLLALAGALPLFCSK
jgi:hypothetical protein